jgi:uncharacterized protein YvpB
MKHSPIAAALFTIGLVACNTQGQTPGGSASSSSSIASSAAAVSTASVASVAKSSLTAVTSSKATATGNVQLKLPFASQAPLGNWDPPYDEACEEASLILVNAYLNGQGMSANDMNAQILATVKWEEDNGYPIDVTMPQLLEIAKGKYGLNGRVIENVTIDDIKNELRAGNPVIAPFAGRDLGNPYFSGLGPWYHVLVITGFDGTYFYTKDVGTKRGDNYKYTHATLFNALHDWTGVKEETNTGPKRVLIVTK